MKSAALKYCAAAMDSIRRGDPEAAAALFQKALEIYPDFPEAMNDLGNTFKIMNRFDQAMDCYRQAITLKPDYAQAHYNLGLLYQQSPGRTRQAAICFENAIRLYPEHAESHNNLGNAYVNLGRLDEAVTSYRTAISLKPDLAESYHNLGNLLAARSADTEQAISCCQKALALKPDYTEALVVLLDLHARTCRWSGLAELKTRLMNLTSSEIERGLKPALDPFSSLKYQDDPAANLAVARAYSRDIALWMSRLDTPYVNYPSRRDQRIKVGYVSRDFRDHPVAHQTIDLYRLHHRTEFEINCYATGPDQGDPFRRKIARTCDLFQDISPLSLQERARLIHRDQVDILVDLTGHTRGGPLGLFFLRPAPIQAGYLGFLGTSGAEFMDYFITDQIVTPKDQAGFYSEQPVYLPHYQVGPARPPKSGPEFTRKDFGLPEQAFVFCSFNSSYKIEPVMFEVWMNLLKQVPGSILWLFRQNPAAEVNLKKEAGQRGVVPDRLVFADRLPLNRHLGRLGLADLALDTRLYNGGATSANALMAGVPLVTLPGRHLVSRMSASSLIAAGLPELVAGTLDQYEALALDLAQNPDRLEKIRRKLELSHETSIMFDTEGFVRNLESAFRAMVEIYRAGEKPRPIEVND